MVFSQQTKQLLKLIAADNKVLKLSSANNYKNRQLIVMSRLKMKKDKIKKEDGRYLIYYDFEQEQEEEEDSSCQR